MLIEVILNHTAGQYAFNAGQHEVNETTAYHSRFHPRAIASELARAVAQLKAGATAEALKICFRQKRYIEQTLGKNSPLIICHKAILGEIYLKDLLLEDAEQLLTEAHKLSLRMFGKHELTVTIALLLGNAQQQLGNFDRAHTIFTSAFTVLKELGSPLSLYANVGLANLFFDRELYEQGLVIIDEIDIFSGQLEAIGINQQALLQRALEAYISSGRSDMACMLMLNYCQQQLYLEAQSAAEIHALIGAFFDTTSPRETGSSAYLLGELFLQLSKTAYGVESVQTAFAMNIAGELEFVCADLNAARTKLTHAAQLYRNLSGTDFKLELSEINYNLGVIALAEENFTEARELLLTAHREYSAIAGRMSDALNCLLSLARGAIVLDYKPAAEEVLLELLRHPAISLPEHQELLSAAKQTQQHLLEAVTAKPAQATPEKSNDALQTSNLFNQALTTLYSGKTADAIKLFEELLAKTIAVCGENHRDTIPILQQLVEAYSSVGNTKVAAKYKTTLNSAQA